MTSFSALAQYGLAEIQQVVEHFRPLLQGCDTVAALREWVDLKAYICRNRHFMDVHPLALFQRISVKDSDEQFSKHPKNHPFDILLPFVKCCM